jgi:hypothetical protein
VRCPGWKKWRAGWLPVSSEPRSAWLGGGGSCTQVRRRCADPWRSSAELLSGGLARRLGEQGRAEARGGAGCAGGS